MDKRLACDELSRVEVRFYHRLSRFNQVPFRLILCRIDHFETLEIVPVPRVTDINIHGLALGEAATPSPGFCRGFVADTFDDQISVRN